MQELPAGKLAIPQFLQRLASRAGVAVGQVNKPSAMGTR